MHTSVRGLIRKDDEIILIHRIKEREDGSIRDYYVVPGGKIEKGETEEEALSREIDEELGIKIKNIEKIIEFKSDYDDSVQIFYLCDYDSGVVGSGTGPEITNKSEYKGIFEPSLIEKTNMININLVPEELKEILYEKVR